jgi:GAF domain-containing protein
MAEPRRELYQGLERDFAALFEGEAGAPWEARLATLIALLKERHPAISWVGAYLEREPGSGTLWIDAYQGKVACLRIPPGKGVCGASFAARQTLVVPDVDRFPGHIACDSLSRSEIVAPIRRGDRWVGVLDLDSHSPDAFGSDDEQGLNRLLALLGNG